MTILSHGKFFLPGFSQDLSVDARTSYGDVDSGALAHPSPISGKDESHLSARQTQ